MRHTSCRLPQTLLAGLLLVASVAGCGKDTPTRGARDVQASVGAMELRDIKLATPRGGVYEVGSAATLECAMVNTGRQDEQLIGVSGPHFQGVVVDGTPTRALPIPIPAGKTVFSSDAAQVALVLTGIDKTLTVARSMPVTLTFRTSGATTVNAVVSSPLRLSIDRYLRQNQPPGNK